MKLLPLLGHSQIDGIKWLEIRVFGESPEGEMKKIYSGMILLLALCLFRRTAAQTVRIESEVHLLAPSVHKTYDGTPLNAELRTDDLPEGYTVEGVAVGSQTNAGSSLSYVEEGYIIRNEAGEDVTASFTNVVTDGLLIVTQAPVTVSTGSADKKFDGTPLMRPEARIEGLAEGENAIVIANGKITEVGSTPNTYVINWGSTNPNNYVIYENLGTLLIGNPDAIPVTVYVTLDEGPAYAYMVSEGLQNMTPTFAIRSEPVGYTVSDFNFIGKVSLTDSGYYMYRFNPNDFVNKNSMYTPFFVADGNELFSFRIGAVQTPITHVDAIFTHRPTGIPCIYPEKLEEQILQLSLYITDGNDAEYISQTLPIDIVYFTMSESVKLPFTFQYDLEDLKSGKYSVEVGGIPEVIKGAIPSNGVDEFTQYDITIESWIDEDGFANIDLYWEEDFDASEELPVLDDEVGTYYFDADGNKVYTAFHTYETCMLYLGNDTACSVYSHIVQ